MTGRPQTLTEGQKKEVTHLLWKQVRKATIFILALLGGIAGLSLWKIKCQLETQLQTLVAAQFKEPRIQAVVSNVAASKAESLMLEEISPAVESFKANIQKQVQETKLLTESTQNGLSELSLLLTATATNAEMSTTKLQKQIDHMGQMEEDFRTALTGAQDSLKSLNSSAEFTMLSLEAQADDRKAYEALGRISDDLKSPYSDQARNLQGVIQRSYWGWMGDKPYVTVDWITNVNPHAFTLPEIQSIWKREILKTSARGFVEYVWSHTNLTKEAKLQFMHDVLANSKNSLQAADKAARLLSEEGGAKYNPPFDFRNIEEWWQQRTTNEPPEKPTTE